MFDVCAYFKLFLYFYAHSLFCLSSHVVRTVNSAEVTAIQRRKKKRKRWKLIPKDKDSELKCWPQDKCTHEQCLKIESQPDFAQRRAQNLHDFKNADYEARVNCVGSHICFPAPAKRKTAESWLNGSGERAKCKASYPKTRFFRFSGFGFGEYRVCFNYLKWFYSIGPNALRTIIRLTWESRRAGHLQYHHKSSYKGFKNTECADQPWVLHVVAFIIANISLEQQHYVASDAKNGLLYMALHGGMKMTFGRVWDLYMQETQPERYAHYLKCLAKKNKKSKFGCGDKEVEHAEKDLGDVAAEDMVVDDAQESQDAHRMESDSDNDIMDDMDVLPSQLLDLYTTQDGAHEEEDEKMEELSRDDTQAASLAEVIANQRMQSCLSGDRAVDGAQETVLRETEDLHALGCEHDDEEAPTIIGGPRPGKAYFCKVLRETLLLTSKRFGQDECNECTMLKVQLDAETDEEKLQELF